MKKEIKTEASKIYFSNGKCIECIYPIKNHVFYNYILIVLLENPLNALYNRNVLAYDEDGNELWQIEDLFPNDGCHYNMIKINEEEMLQLYNWCGFVIRLNPKTGKIVATQFTK